MSEDDVARQLIDTVDYDTSAIRSDRRAYLRSLAAEAIYYLHGVTRVDDPIHMFGCFGVVEQILQEAKAEMQRGPL